MTVYINDVIIHVYNERYILLAQAHRDGVIIDKY